MHLHSEENNLPHRDLQCISQSCYGSSINIPTTCWREPAGCLVGFDLQMIGRIWEDFPVWYLNWVLSLMDLLLKCRWLKQLYLLSVKIIFLIVIAFACSLNDGVCGSSLVAISAQPSKMRPLSQIHCRTFNTLKQYISSFTCISLSSNYLPFWKILSMLSWICSMNVVFPKSLQLRWLVKEMAVWIADCFGSYLWHQYFVSVIPFLIWFWELS